METSVFRKTQKGAQEVANHHHGLQHKLRCALVVIEDAEDRSESSVVRHPCEVASVFQQLPKRGRTLRNKLLGECDVLVDALGHEGAAQLGNEIGSTRTRLVPR